MSIYKTFRTARNVPASFNAMSPRFDQPTYLSFKLEFASGRDILYNQAAPGGKGTVINYDKMPHPLFGIKGTDNVDNRETYSAIDYLYDANEFTRARMLEQWIEHFNNFQYKYQWYFQKLDGISDLLQINPISGQRILSDKRLTVTTLEAVDLRMSHLLNMYRKIVWDDTYQRWVLPDMMRYFSLKIYIAEFRVFHTPSPYNGYGYASLPKYKNEDVLELQRLDNILPTWVINCEMCEFDLENLNFTYLDSLGIGEEPEMAGLSFGIKVGKIYEEQVYPTFQNTYLFDKNLNGYDRAVNQTLGEVDRATLNNDTLSAVGNRAVYGEVPYDSTDPKFAGADLSKEYTRVAQSESVGNDPETGDQVHDSTYPFNEQNNQKTLNGIPSGGPGRDGKFFTSDDVNEAPIGRNPWVVKAIDFGGAFVKNAVNEKIDKAKMTSIPGLGVSFTDIKSALESKNIITALGMIRKGVNTVAAGYVQPSELLEGKIVDGMFRAYLEGVATSEATGDNQLIQEAANIALNDDGVWGKIKDYSRATDLVGINNGETNAANPIEGGKGYENVTSEATQGDNSFATDLVGKGETNVPKPVKIENQKIYGNILEGVPSSKATSNQILKG